MFLTAHVYGLSCAARQDEEWDGRSFVQIEINPDNAVRKSYNKVRSNLKSNFRLLAVCFSLEVICGGYEARRTAKGDGTRHGRGTREKKNKLQSLLMFSRTFRLVLNNLINQLKSTSVSRE